MLMILIGCASHEPRSPQSTSSLPEAPDLREEGLLLLMADRRYYDSFTVGSIRFENPELKASLATSLGRIGDRRGAPLLRTFLLEAGPPVRRETAFALGLIGDPESTPNLLAAAADSDLETAIWSVAYLAELGVDVDRVLQSLQQLSDKARWQRLSPYLFRFAPASVRAVAEQGLSVQDNQIRAMSIFALARNPQLESLAILRFQVDDPDPWVRTWVGRALGQVGDRTDMTRLRTLLDDRQPGPIIEALRAGHRLVGNGMAAPAPDWRPRLMELFQDHRPGVALTAMESSAPWLLDEELGNALMERAKSGSTRQQEVALLALAAGGDPRAGDYALRLVTSPEDWQRALAGTVASRLGDLEALQYLMLDDSARVRQAALTGTLEQGGMLAAGVAIDALEDPDPGVRALVMEWLIENPVAPAGLMSKAIIGPEDRKVIDLRLYGIRALEARAVREPLERGLVVENLEFLARVGEYPARRAARQALVGLDRPEPALGPAGSNKSATTYMQVVLQTDKDHLIEIGTRHGNLQVELECSQARMTCLNFLQLSRQGFFDGQSFHRVVPGFVIQAGDPRGDGWGGPGYTLRDELSRTPYERGVIGMASSGPDTAGSQFFITLSRQPHLDGRYTAFGRVVRGDEILDLIVQGDRLERVVEVR